MQRQNFGIVEDQTIIDLAQEMCRGVLLKVTLQAANSFEKRCRDDVS
jgi:hypothetical protein